MLLNGAILCKLAGKAEIEAQGWSLNLGRYVGVAERAADDFDFMERLNFEAYELEEKITENIGKSIEGIA